MKTFQIDKKSLFGQASLLFYSAAGMLITLFCSRTALALLMGFFIAVALVHKEFNKQIGQFLRSPLLWSMSLLFLLPFISGLWSEDKSNWVSVIYLKLPLLFMPLAFAGNWFFTKRQWEILALLFIGLVTAGSIWSLAQYLGNMAAVHEEYLKAKTLLSPHDIDRVRFGWMISVSILLCSWLGIQKRKTFPLFSIILLVNAVLLIIFLHVLAVRTGLLSFYSMVLISAIWLAFRGRRTAWALLIIVALPILAYKVFPTFHNRVRYFLYEMPYFKNASYLPGANDAVRVISIKAGWAVFNQHPVTGVGFGDISKQVSDWYEKNYPQMLAQDRIEPSSQWILYGDGCGWLGFLAFITIMIIPFTIKARIGLPWYLLNASMLISLVFDVGLEIQYGVFLYTFMVLWCWKWREN
ncbi:MAG TPA: O-antigen ligase family protein [Chitinophagaceae bacterium]|nr:O-antigen ligase family protein [Chitinophagaceae bacterium]